ncbi:UNVERIFIED_CONTAM: Jrkl [Trichonephila clavipes]
MKDACYMLAVAWDSFKRQSLKNAWNKLCQNLEGEKDFNDDHRESNRSQDFKNASDEDVETWMAFDAEDYGFQMLNDHEIMTSVQEESDPVVDETEEDEDNNNESSKSPSNADAFSAFETAMTATIRVLSSTIAAQENQRPCSEKQKVYNDTAKNK